MSGIFFIGFCTIFIVTPSNYTYFLCGERGSSSQIWFNTVTFPCNIVKTLEMRQYSCEFCLVTEKIAKY